MCICGINLNSSDTISKILSRPSNGKIWQIAMVSLWGFLIISTLLKHSLTVFSNDPCIRWSWPDSKPFPQERSLRGPQWIERGRHPIWVLKVAFNIWWKGWEGIRIFLIFRHGRIPVLSCWKGRMKLEKGTDSSCFWSLRISGCSHGFIGPSIHGRVGQWRWCWGEVLFTLQDVRKGDAKRCCGASSGC